MRINLVKLYLLIFITAALQMIINSTTILYLDGIAVVLVIILATEIYSLRMLVIISLIADLIGHWYLGTHLLATIMVSFFTHHLKIFFRMSNNFQKYLILVFYYLALEGIIFSVSILSHNFNFNLLSYAINIFVLIPALLTLHNKFVIKNSMDLIY